MPIEIEESLPAFAAYPTETECSPFDSVSAPNATLLNLIVFASLPIAIDSIAWVFALCPIAIDSCEVRLELAFTPTAIEY